MHTGYLAAFATLFAWTISSFVLAKLSRLTDPSILNKAVLFFSIFLLGSLVCILDHLTPWQLFTGANASNWFWLGLSGILGKSIGDYCGFCSMRILGVRRRSMITTLGPGFTLLFGWIILKEEMNWLGIAAMLLTTISLLLLINSTAEKEEVKNEKFGLPLPGLLYGVASAALTGLAFILSKKTFIETDSKLSAFHATWIRILVAFLAIMLVDVVRKKHPSFITPFITGRQKAVLLFLTILFGAVLGLSFSLMAITQMNAAAAYTIFAMLPVTVIAVNVIIYKKKLTLKSWMYSILAIIGVIVLIWRDSLIEYF
jgi:drug/metabolite transporter (DMT)-like permease